MTVVTEIEAILNSSPLIHVDIPANDGITPLTPGYPGKLLSSMAGKGFVNGQGYQTDGISMGLLLKPIAPLTTGIDPFEKKGPATSHSSSEKGHTC